MTKMHELMPVMARHEGQWVGTYTHIDRAGALVDTYEVHCLSEFPDDGSCDFRLSTRNVWTDGRETTASYGADFRDGRLWWRDGLTGWMQEIDDLTVYLRFGFEHDTSILVCEMIQISHDGQNRARTWHWFRDEILFQTTLTNERRVS